MFLSFFLTKHDDFADVLVYNDLRRKIFWKLCSVYLNLHITEQRLAVQQLVKLPTPADLPHISLPRHQMGYIRHRATQVAEVTCSLGWDII